MTSLIAITPSPFLRKFLLEECREKMKEDEIAEATITLTTPKTLDFIKQTLFCYSGNHLKIDPLLRRPVEFIGPLQFEPLPDSPVRRICWIASLTFGNNELELFDFWGTLPGIDIVQRVNFRESRPFDGSSESIEIDCFDEAFQDEPLFKDALQSFDSMKTLRNLAFGHPRPYLPIAEEECLLSTPTRFLKDMGYKQVSTGAPGDLIVYFAHISVTPSDAGLPVYSPKPRVSHFGRVIKIQNNGSPLVRSKFGPFHVYHHSVDGIPYYYGDSYLYYSKKPPGADDSKDHS